MSLLQTQAGAGRLTLDEFSERSAAAYRAGTIGDLNVLTEDLPTPQPTRPHTARSGNPVLRSSRPYRGARGDHVK